MTLKELSMITKEAICICTDDGDIFLFEDDGEYMDREISNIEIISHPNVIRVELAGEKQKQPATSAIDNILAIVSAKADSVLKKYLTDDLADVSRAYVIRAEIMNGLAYALANAEDTEEA